MRIRRLLAGAGLGAAMAGLACQENVTAPGSCPTLCPSARVTLVDTVLTGFVTADSSFRGYYGPYEAPTMPVANLDSLHSIAVIRFGARDSTWYPAVNDTQVHVGSVDSVVLRLEISGRDKNVAPVRIVAYRLPSAFDTGITWSQVQPYLADSLLVDTVTVPDSITTGEVVWRIRPSGLTALMQPDTGVAALALVMESPQPTSLLVWQSGSALGGPYLDWYVHAIAPRDSLSNVFSVGASFDTFVYDPPTQAPAGSLAAGGLPSARSILRLSLSSTVLDSARLVRATLILTTTGPARGLASDTFRVAARGLVRDLGPKSVLFADTAAGGTTPVAPGDSGEIHIEIGRLLRAWGTTAGDSLPKVIMLLAEPEGGGLGEVRVAGRSAGALAPRLRVTYVRPYAFGVP